MINKTILFLSFILFSSLCYSQNRLANIAQGIGISYYGELAFRPGLELDYGLKIWEKDKKKHLALRPFIAFYHYPHFSNNLLLGTNLNYQLCFMNKKGKKGFMIEPFVKLGYLRYFLLGTIYVPEEGNVEQVTFRGSSSFVAGGGFNFGGAVTNKSEWLAGFDYFAEFSEDNLVLHRFFLKLGARINFDSE